MLDFPFESMRGKPAVLSKSENAESDVLPSKTSYLAKGENERTGKF